MAFKVAVVFMAPDGDPQVHRALLKTSKLEFTAVVVRLGDVDQAVDVCRSLAQKDGVRHIMLCPGFAHEAVGKIKQTVGENVAITVARGDVHNSVLLMQILAQEGWIPQQHLSAHP
jgi:hypothetical protein